MSDWYSLLLGGAPDPALSPRDAKRALARALVERFHEGPAAAAAEEHFDRVIVRHEAPADVAEVTFTAGDGTVHLPALLAAAFGVSTSEARRSLGQGAVRLDGTPVPTGALGLPRRRRRAGAPAWQASLCPRPGGWTAGGRRARSRVTVHGGILAHETRGTAQLSTSPTGCGVLWHRRRARGVVIVFVVGSTAAITTMEYEPGGVADLLGLLDRLIPARGEYEHNRLNHDSNSHAHQRAALIGPSESIPIVDGRLSLGTWQQIVLLDFDDRPRHRTVTVQVLC